MPVSHIEHLLLLVDDVDATADWFVNNIGLSRGHTPDFKVKVTWLYIGEKDDEPNERKRPIYNEVLKFLFGFQIISEF